MFMELARKGNGLRPPKVCIIYNCYLHRNFSVIRRGGGGYVTLSNLFLTFLVSTWFWFPGGQDIFMSLDNLLALFNDLKNCVKLF